MPTMFPEYDPATDELVDRAYLTLDEVAERIHLGRTAIYNRVRAGVWDALHVGRHYFMSPAQVGAAMEQMQSDNRPEDPTPVTLGTPVADADLEPLT